MLVNNKHNDSGIFRTNKRGLGVYYLPIVEVCIKKRYFLGTKFQNRIKYFCLVIWQKVSAFDWGHRSLKLGELQFFSQYRLKYYYYYSWPVTFREKTLDKVCSRTTKKNNDKRFSTLVCFFLQITTPSKRYLEYGYLSGVKPFYRQPWFLVALAAASIVITIVVVAILCVKSKSYKYKGKWIFIVLQKIGTYIFLSYM